MFSCLFSCLISEQTEHAAVSGPQNPHAHRWVVRVLVFFVKDPFEQLQSFMAHDIGQ